MKNPTVETRKRCSGIITLGLLATMAISLTGCDSEQAKQRRAAECLSGQRDRTSEKCRIALAAYPAGYATPLRRTGSGFGGGWFGGWGRYGGGSSSSSTPSDGSVSRGGFGASASGHGGGEGGGE